MTSTSVLTSSPTSTWTTGPFTTQTPAPTPIPGSLDTPWYFSDVLDLPALILYGIVGANLVLSFTAWFVLKCCLHRPRSARRVRFVAPIVHFLVFFLFEFVVLCARLHAWTTNDNEYTPSWTAEGEMVFPSPAFSSSLSPDFLREVGCGDFILTNGTTSTLEPVGPSECSLGIRIGAKLSPGTVATISLVLGLMGFVLLEMFVLLLEMGDGRELERLKLKTLVMLPSLKAVLKRDISVDDFNNSRDEDFDEEEQGLVERQRHTAEGCAKEQARTMALRGRKRRAIAAVEEGHQLTQLAWNERVDKEHADTQKLFPTAADTESSGHFRKLEDLIQRFHMGDARSSALESSQGWGALQFADKASEVPYLCLSTEDSPMDACEFAELMLMRQRGRSFVQPNLVVSATGGARQFTLADDTQRQLTQFLQLVSQRTNAWITTGGCDTGCMKLAADILQQTEEDNSRHAPFVIGIGTFGVIKNHEALISAGDPPHHIDYSSLGDNHTFGVALNAQHDLFLLVDDGTRSRFGVEIAFRQAFEQAAAQHFHAPAVTVVIQGGPGILYTACRSAQDGWPVLVMANSGLAADIIAYAYHFTHSPLPEHTSLTWEGLQGLIKDNFATGDDSARLRRLLDDALEVAHNDLVRVIGGQGKTLDDMMQTFLEVTSGADTPEAIRVKYEMLFHEYADSLNLDRKSLSLKSYDTSDLHMLLRIALDTNNHVYTEDLIMLLGEHIGELLEPALRAVPTMVIRSLSTDRFSSAYRKRVSPTVQECIARLIEKDLGEAVDTAAECPLMQVADSTSRSELMHAAINNDVSVAMRLATDFFELKPEPEFASAPVTARLRPGELVVVGKDELWKRDKKSALYRELRRQTGNNANVRTQALALDMEQACTKEPDSLFSEIIASGKAELFQLLALRAAVQLRWVTYGRTLFFFEGVQYLVSLCLLVFLSLTMTTFGTPPSGSHYRAVIATISLTSLAALNEVKQLLRSRSRYFSNIWNWLDMARAALTLSFCILHLQGDTQARTLLAYAVIVQWLRLLYFLLPFDSTGPLIIMILEILKDTYVFLIVLVTVVLGASNSLFVLLHHSSSGVASTSSFASADGFSDVALALFTSANMLLFGDYDQTLFDDSSDGISARVIFVAVMFVTLVILLNLLIAILSDSYERVQDRSAMELTLAKAQILDDQQFLLHRYLLVACGTLWNYVIAQPLAATAGLLNSHWRVLILERFMVDTSSVCTWPAEAVVLIPETSTQRTQPASRWQGMLNHLKLNVNDRADGIQEQASASWLAVSELASQNAEMLKHMRSEMADMQRAMNSNFARLQQSIEQGNPTTSQTQTAGQQSSQTTLQQQERQHHRLDSADYTDMEELPATAAAAADAKHDKDTVPAATRAQDGFVPPEEYPGSNGVKRFTIDASQVPWDVVFPDYEPVEYTHPAVARQPVWADPADPREIKFNVKDEVFGRVVDRTSCHPSGISIDSSTGRPINPWGRTGMTGRGLLGKWGVNQAADMVVTRWKRAPDGSILQRDGKKVLEFVAIQRMDNNMWAIPGGFVDNGEDVALTSGREFMEEALGTKDKRGALSKEEEKSVAQLFADGTIVDRIYGEDPRNTDNAWVETTCVNFHDESGRHAACLQLGSDDDARTARWMMVHGGWNLFASQRKLLQLVARHHSAYF
ncbi:Nudt9 protein [Salpingoeca rosetta]|uniref:Nudt9 protein n=1 Tax=Salpingoeca rosetta (strain ATCC 50818 / BSB-021) TaxID=946362 RepID=F2USX8_SALR5|nr:Nudt9 protein [Salpingoeca rosetta]EGD81237.1 Nudt9 protein [Salpingoeca rosetta]|eukprot:XP_004987771.1 Nudt9 protein [Salpingoeca rosetta]